MWCKQLDYTVAIITARCADLQCQNSNTIAIDAGKDTDYDESGIATKVGAGAPPLFGRVI